MSAEAARREMERVLQQDMVTGTSTGTEENVETWLEAMKKYWDRLIAAGISSNSGTKSQRMQ